MESLPKDLENMISDYAKLAPGVMTLVLNTHTCTTRIAFLHMAGADKINEETYLKVIIHIVNNETKEAVNDTHYIGKYFINEYIFNEIESVKKNEGLVCSIINDRRESWLARYRPSYIKYINDIDNCHNEVAYCTNMFDNLFF